MSLIRILGRHRPPGRTEETTMPPTVSCQLAAAPRRPALARRAEPIRVHSSQMEIDHVHS
jgi:hypothetical protein